MTLKELYGAIDGNYDQAIKVMKMDRLIDKHIRKLEKSGLNAALQAAGESMDPRALFDSAHAMKGVCSNLALLHLAAAVSDIAEEFREGNARKLSDDEVRARLQEIDEMYRRAEEGIRDYIAQA